VLYQITGLSLGKNYPMLKMKDRSK